MEINDYWKMVRRGWTTILLVTLLGLSAAAAYVALVPRRYEATTALYVTASSPNSVADLEQGSNFATKAVATYASIVDSATILGPAASQLSPPSDVEEMGAAVSATAPEDSTLITIVGAATSASRAADIANAVARSSVQVLPSLERDATGRSLVRVEQTRTALPPALAVTPNVKQSLLVGLLAGMLLGTIGTVVRQSTDTRISRPENLRGVTSIPLLAEIPYARGTSSNSLVSRDDPSSQAGSSYRTLRTNLGFVENWPVRSLMFTNIGADNSAEVATNLAWTLAQTGRSVVLVDADLENAGVSKLLNSANTIGLAEILLGKAELSDTVLVTLRSALSVVPAGSLTSNPTDLLCNRAMDVLLRRLENEFHYVIVHAPPVRAGADAAVLAGKVGGVLLGIESKKSRLAHLAAALTALSIVAVKPAGLVMTGSTTKSRLSNTEIASRHDGVELAPSQTPTASELDAPTLRQVPSSRPPSPIRRTAPNSEVTASRNGWNLKRGAAD